MPINDPNRRSEPDGEPLPRHDGGDVGPIPGGVLAIILAALAVALVLGYLFVNKMADISHQEDCVLANRRAC